MPLETPGRIEYAIDSGFITIMSDGGQRIPAYWAHPQEGSRFSGISLVHDWWGVTGTIRALANYYAQMGYYVIVPDLFDGKTATSPRDAMGLVEATKTTRYEAVDTSLTVLERHHRTTSNVAAIGCGMGGTLAFEAACRRTDLEAAIAYCGFPQAYMGQFQHCKTPILAIYGSLEPYTKPVVIKAMQDELTRSPAAENHRVEIIPDAGHDFFFDAPTPQQREQGLQVINHTLEFLDKFLDKPDFHGTRRGY
jgi:carboxymethylenebutenolidase